ncbi:MAG: hypothetical protein ACQEP1_05305, partial [Nanobdellota archaeon]
MMTYGWAIIVVLITVGTLFQTEVIDMNSRLSDNAHFPPPFTVKDFSPSDDSIRFIMKNDLPHNITVLPYGYKSSGDCNLTSLDVPGEVGAYENFNMTFYCDMDKDRIISGLSFLHNDSHSGNVHRSTGKVVIR